MTTKLPAELLDDLKHEEGWREAPYFDSENYLTIGWGFLIDPRKAVKLPRAVGDLWLEHAARERWEALVSRAPWILDQPQDVQRALANMSYQLGVVGLLKFQRMLSALQRGERAKAADYALQSLWARQTPHRARRVASLIRGAEVPANQDSGPA